MTRTYNTHIFIYVYIHTYIHTYVCIYIYIYTHMNIRVGYKYTTIPPEIWVHSAVVSDMSHELRIWVMTCVHVTSIVWCVRVLVCLNVRIEFFPACICFGSFESVLQCVAECCSVCLPPHEIHIRKYVYTCIYIHWLSFGSMHRVHESIYKYACVCLCACVGIYMIV